MFEHGADREVLKTVIKAYPFVRIFFLSVDRHLVRIDRGAVHSLPLWHRANSAEDDSGLCGPCARHFSGFLSSVFASRGTFDHRPLNPSLGVIYHQPDRQ